MPRVSFLLGLIFCFACGAGLSQEVLKLASPFTDGAILQRDQPVPVWGWAEEGARVTVKFAGQEKSAVAARGGRWEVSLDPMPGSFENRMLAVISGHEERVCKEIQVGEVWICSGQSNMRMGSGQIPEIRNLVRDAEHIRSFDVEKNVSFEESDFCSGTWKKQVPRSAVAATFAYDLQKAAKVPVGVIVTCWGSSGIEGWMPADMVETVPHFRTAMSDFEKNSAAREEIQRILDGPRPWTSKEDVFLRRQSNLLYNAMMHPLAPFANRGLIWYQGERNTQSMHGMPEKPWYSRNSGMLKYGETLQQWIRRYRQEWNQDEMNFIVVMLPGYGKSLAGGPSLDPEHPTAHSWAWLRESQLKALDLPHTAVVNTIDLGDLKEVHPKDKLPIGQRAALLAIKNTLGSDSQVVAHGPIMKAVAQQAGSLVVKFDHAEGLTTIDGEPPSAFWIAGDDQNWVPAKARIAGSSVILTLPEVQQPVHVRYAFAGKPKVNLVNGAGLPAYPFRSDELKP